jgi:hypothetical protein
MPHTLPEPGVLTLFERFTFSALPCSIRDAAEAIEEQTRTWGKSLIDVEIPADVRAIKLSADTPDRGYAPSIAFMLIEEAGPNGPVTLSVCNAPDGYVSLLYTVSKSIPGTHYMFEVSRPTVEYPRNAITAVEARKRRRVVYSMRDSNGWVFYEDGTALPIENAKHYAARYKRDRLTPEIIEAALKRFGYGSVALAFWTASNRNALLLRDEAFRIWNGGNTRP